MINREKEGRYTICKTIFGDPHQNCLLMRTCLEAPAELLSMSQSSFDDRLPKKK